MRRSGGFVTALVRATLAKLRLGTSQDSHRRDRFEGLDWEHAWVRPDPTV